MRDNKIEVVLIIAVAILAVFFIQDHVADSVKEEGWKNDIRACTTLTKPNRQKTNNVLFGGVEKIAESGWKSRRELARINREQGNNELAKENHRTAIELHAIYVNARDTKLTDPSCLETYPKP